mmetsp:Transcript_5001/g.7584  ORF Transcript_5001/g.7584 Transcript_5001/m.7584 type:complete len:706 (+) Transcript_5001:201-2318(+)|eukprot:CAMPEP_0195306216 /NCGR_PEP_ID=MMETSP0707-20130614/37087_1 /TAXON_ID=33640 /ORGANISM="Asterionellopsis glacialis, Strain CCMP134" /LENGTH=705 /DNA_ID=CAMNT_0040370427 /DNA_START=143 /DNA_END=2260 /DNA_ORIENTATION=-
MKLATAATALLLWSSASAFGIAESGKINSSVNSGTFHKQHHQAFLTKNQSTSTNIWKNTRGGASSSSSLNSAAVSSSAVSTANLDLLSERGRTSIEKLIANDDGSQAHVYSDWPEAGVQDEGKISLAEQLADLDESYPGGLAAYLTKAKALLKESAEGVNPFSEFEASVPEGESLSYDGYSTPSMPFTDAEQEGLRGIADVVFVLVAGGLGERLGYSGIKLSLETNLCTNKSYLEVYVKYIQAMQHLAELKTGRTNVKIPLVIMTSGDTDPMTRELLKEHENFGMDDDQIQIVMQDKVAALKDVTAGLALDDNDRWQIQTKPHGHGDVHHLLYREGFVDKWEEQGKKHVIFLQDTNALVINSIVPTLGVSLAKGFHMNSICIPRLAGEAAGAIARLEHKTDSEKSLVINVEYNQLDPLLSTQGDRKGDVADDTGYSPYPGNANNLVIEMGAYAKTLRGEDQGVVLEFVNPKYKDATRTDFKKPTRLECMMQDIPKLFQKEMGSTANIGFTTFDRWFTFSPAKNSLESGIEAVAGGNTAPGTMSSAESDKYIQNQRKLKFAGMDVDVTHDEADFVTVGGIPVTPGPRIILCPGFAITQEEVMNKIEGGKITKRSSLVLEGQHLKVKNLDLDGALVIRAGPECDVTVDGLSVQNKGWELEELPKDVDVAETVAIRGYTMAKHESTEILITEPGKFFVGKDGVVQKLE